MMANPRKLSAFRQLSLHCDSPQAVRARPHPIRIAWAEDSDEGLIARKCVKEPKKTLTRHSSLEKDSILYGKHDLTEKILQNTTKTEKPNLNIFLTHNTNPAEEISFEEEVLETEPKVTSVPKIVQPLVAPNENLANVFQIRKSRDLAFSKSTAVVVVPLIENPSDPPSTAIKNVIIRPSTAAAKRERFQKRTNSAFNSVIKDGTDTETIRTNPRPPLVRSSSAPASKPDKPKFLATKRKIKSGKKRPNKEDEDNTKENPKELNRFVGTEIVTMVSLVSPAASDNEEIEVVEKPKPKNSPTKKKEETPKNLSLRKTVKSVSFQQSSIHAIRSFSASFPARRGSMATALMLNNNLKNNPKNQQEKRGTNSTVSDDDERVAKRRLVRSATDQNKSIDEDGLKEEKIQDPGNDSITVTITSKTLKKSVETVENKTNGVFETPSTSTPENKTENSCEVNPEIAATKMEDKKEEEEEENDSNPQFGSAKERQCWDMYCKMSDKGLKVSYDTILRGMLTPTEYRMRRKESLVNVIPEETTTPTKE